jgi:hypothetical protein
MLSEFYEYGGAFGQGPVGCGKTLITTLASLVMSFLPEERRPKRPWLVVPAALRSKTYTDIQKASKHWRVPRCRIGVSTEDNVLSIVSYSEISVTTGFGRLDRGAPDCLIFDEAHSIKSLKASVTRKFHQHILRRRKQGLPTYVMLLSGTMAKRSLHDFWHLLFYARPDHMPLPVRYVDLADWALALDEKVLASERLDPSELLVLDRGDVEPEEDGSAMVYARKVVQKRIFSTPGILTSRSAEVDCSLRVEGYEFPPPPECEEAFAQLRSSENPCTPDGWPLSDSLSVWRHATEIALGFYSYWDPRPSQEWMDARRTWYSEVREALDNNAHTGLDHRSHLTSTRDVALLVQHLIKHGMSSSERERWGATVEAFQVWKAIEPTFTPPIEPPAAWVSDAALRHVAAWKGPGVVWTWHRPFARKLAELTKWPYYGSGGLNARGGRIDDEKPENTVIASIHANQQGRNLQFWNKSLIVFPPPTGNIFEQVAGRMHRSGQMADEVVYEVMIGCTEHFRGFVQSKRDAKFHRTMLDAPAKLEYCDVVIPEIVHRDSWAFRGVDKRIGEED